MAVQGSKNTKNNDKLNTIWESATQQLKNLLNEETYTQWITPVLPVSHDEKNFVLGVSDEIFLSLKKIPGLGKKLRLILNGVDTSEVLETESINHDLSVLKNNFSA